MSSKPSMENPIDLIALIILVTFLKHSPPFATCNSQLRYLPLFYFSPISVHSNKWLNFEEQRTHSM